MNAHRISAVASTPSYLTPLTTMLIEPKISDKDYVQIGLERVREFWN